MVIVVLAIQNAVVNNTTTRGYKKFISREGGAIFFANSPEVGIKSQA